MWRCARPLIQSYRPFAASVGPRHSSLEVESGRDPATTPAVRAIATSTVPASAEPPIPPAATAEAQHPAQHGHLELDTLFPVGPQFWKMGRSPQIEGGVARPRFLGAGGATTSPFHMGIITRRVDSAKGRMARFAEH